ncbi:MAG: TIR domain-containing protein [Candidatus Zixiibacteriota bacterium]
MLKAFLSYSSKQKGYVESVAKQLGKSTIIFDKWTFEEGNKTVDEIFNGLSETDLFVLFLSNEALESDWIKTEIGKAYELLKVGNIKRLYPIIIDENIKYDDKRIPAWIQENYNLKYVSRPTKAAERIKQILRTLSWELYPRNNQLAQLFIGRTELIRKYEERIFDFDKPIPITIITTGLPSIGRRKFTLHCLKKSNKIRESYSPPTIYLAGRDSIENLIISLYDLGLSNIERKELLSLLCRGMDDKISLATKLLLEVEKHEKIIFILDNHSIVRQESHIVDWFLEIIANLRKIERLFICLISKRRIRQKQLLNNDYIYTIEIPELEKYERNALFNALLELDGIQLNKQDFHTISELFNGFPEQVFFTFNILITRGLQYLLDNLHLIPDYNSEKVASLVQKYESDEFAVQILRFLSDCEFVSLPILEVVINEEFSRIKSLIEEFSNSFIIEFIGATREYFRLNETIRDYIQRLGIKLHKTYLQNLENHVKSAFNDYDTLDRDLSDYAISVKEALKKGYQIPQDLLIPSHFLNAMRDLYNDERRYKDVIELADRVLLNENYLDDRICREVRYWLCLSLARRKDKRILEEVQKIDGADHNFLLGFYYRLVGRFEDAVKRLTDVLQVSPSFYRAKRELVQVYINLEEYDKAYDLAKENYETEKNNPYNLQSYFRCLIKSSTISIRDKKGELTKLLENLNNNIHDKAKEMYMTSKAQFYAIVENDRYGAFNTIHDGIAAFPKSIYPPLLKIEICLWFSDWDELERTLNLIDESFSPDTDIFSKLSYLYAKAKVIAKKRGKRECMRFMDVKIKNNFSETVYNKLREEIDSLTLLD